MADRYVPREEVLALFELLREKHVKYALLRNIDNELPDRLSVSKDIDLLVHPSHQSHLSQILGFHGWKEIRHPWAPENHFVYLYSMLPFQMYTKGHLNLDIAYQLSCRSLSQGQWVPLDQIIQNEVWLRRIDDFNTPWRYQLGSEHEAIHLITRCVFDKKGFPLGYRKRLESLWPCLDMADFRVQLELVFFKFAPVLEMHLRDRRYDEIRVHYLRYRDY